MVRDDDRPEPREEKRDPDFILRSNRISLFLTLLTLAATVVTVYLVFPRRDNVLMTRAAEEYREPQPLEIESPSPPELGAWTAGAVGSRDVPWPTAGGAVEVEGARALDIQNRRAALVRYQIGGDRVVMIAQRGRDVPPRRHKRQDGDETVVSWRAGKWTMVAVGPTATAETWIALVGAGK